MFCYDCSVTFTLFTLACCWTCRCVDVVFLGFYHSLGRASSVLPCVFPVFPVFPCLSMFLFVRWCGRGPPFLAPSFALFLHTCLESAHHLTHLLTCLHFPIDHSISTGPFLLVFVSSSVMAFLCSCALLLCLPMVSGSSVLVFLYLPVTCLPQLACKPLVKINLWSASALSS